MAEIGAMLREARMRARIDVSEIEAQTKIRAKYLRALENEEWDLLPGPTYVKSFLRTYAQALGLDARLIVEQYRLNYERPTEHELVPLAPSSTRSRPAPSRRGGSGPRRPIPGIWLAAGGAVVLVIFLVVLGSLGSGGSKHHPTTPLKTVTAVTTPRHHTHAVTTPPPTAPAYASLQLRPTAAVYVCLVTSLGHKVLNGVILSPGEPETVHRAHVFILTLGNGDLTMKVNGKVMTVPQSSTPLTYAVSSHGRRLLPASDAPNCP
ncbi:MAG TPA: helix-turn-helix transcriptional regulator [Solirubrobacteraceae bacterium]|nr:helix-turn-helix transcriptional regulator [Solirubrobacteraceae bacterium]